MDGWDVGFAILSLLPSISRERMSCSHDHHEHGGDDHGHGHGHDHSHDVPLEAGPQDSLYPQIDLEHVVGLNAVGGGESGKNVIKWVSRYYASRLMVDLGPTEKMSSEWVST